MPKLTCHLPCCQGQLRVGTPVGIGHNSINDWTPNKAKRLHYIDIFSSSFFLLGGLVCQSRRNVSCKTSHPHLAVKFILANANNTLFHKQLNLRRIKGRSLYPYFLQHPSIKRKRHKTNVRSSSRINISPRRSTFCSPSNRMFWQED